jgi:hypothetical protein
MTYPQQHGGYPQQPNPGQYGQFGGYGRPPQKQSNTAVAVVMVAVLVLAGLGITGFVAPGFFLDDDKDSAGGPGIGQTGPAGGSGSLPGPPSPGGPDGSPGGSGDGDSGSADAEALVEEFLNAVNAKDAAKAEGMYCSDTPSNPLVDYVIGKNPRLTLGEVDRPGSSFVSYKLDGTLDGEPLNLGKVSVRVSGRESPCIFTFNAG